jgi:hypothetical protein
MGEACRECQGCGYVEYVAGSYYSASFGNYLPREAIARCTACGGTGRVEVWDEGEAVFEESRSA